MTVGDDLKRSAPAPVRVERFADRRARVVVAGPLDRRGATALETVFEQLVSDSPRRLELDLSGVTEVTADGVTAMTQCLAIGRRFDEGVGVTVANDAGRRALLESMASV